MNSKNTKLVEWSVKIIAFLTLIFGLPFYFGYGNPLPFARQEYTASYNLWLIAFLLMFVGLALGLKYEKTGGYLLITSLLMGIGILIIAGTGSGMHILISLIFGSGYLIVGYKK